MRRLVSEGTRPRLPSAPRLRAIAADPTPILPLLAALRDDPAAYVRRSVANSLSDISKDHPDLAVAVLAEWLDGEPPARLRLARHAPRTLRKAGDPDSGGTSARIFSAGEAEVVPGGRARLGAGISLRQHTTRTHHPGERRVEVLVNGRRLAERTFGWGPGAPSEDTARFIATTTLPPPEVVP